MALPVNYSTNISDTPLKENPRNPLVEAVLNIAKIIKDEVTYPNPKFAPPHVSRVYADWLNRPPDVYPAVDIRFNSMLPTDYQELGTNSPLVQKPCIYEVRYHYAMMSDEGKELEVTRQLYRLADILMYRNDLHGVCPRQRASVSGIVNGPNVFFVALDTPEVTTGGIITLEVPVVMHRTFFDGGMSERDVVFSDGMRD